MGGVFFPDKPEQGWMGTKGKKGQNQPGEPNKPRILKDCTVDESEIRKNHSSAGIRESYLHAVLKSSSTVIG